MATPSTLWEYRWPWQRGENMAPLMASMIGKDVFRTVTSRVRLQR
jgi:hypothetical protein